MAVNDDPKPRGLRAVEDSRIARRRALVLGKVRLQGDSSRFWLWTFVLFAAFGIIYWKHAEAELESQKSAVMAKQRAIAHALGPRLFPFRDQAERWTSDLTGPWPGDEVAPQARLDAIAKGPGVYLRLRLHAAESGKVAEAAVESLHDGFTSCLFVRKDKVNPASGKACRSPSHCESGELCNEWNVCSPPTQPYNMRLAYRALRVLSTDWTDELHQAPTDLAVRVFEHDLEKVSNEEVPVAIDLLSRARFFTLVLDEDPKDGLEQPKADEEPPETALQKLQRLPHHARIGIWDLRERRQLVRKRLAADAQVIPVGRRTVADPVSKRAQQRQVNSCALALGIRQALAGTAPSPGTP